MMTPRTLTDIVDLLNSDGINYSVSLRMYSGLRESTDDINSIVNRLIGHEAVLNGVRDVGMTELVDTLLQSLGYVGDNGAGPGPNVLRSAAFSRLLRNIRNSVVQLSQTVDGIKSFEFADGHPDYPVFWDFAYLFLGSDQHVLLVGSSWD
jgi:hypothetical protein